MLFSVQGVLPNLVRPESQGQMRGLIECYFIIAIKLRF